MPRAKKKVATSVIDRVATDVDVDVDMSESLAEEGPGPGVSSFLSEAREKIGDEGIENHHVRRFVTGSLAMNYAFGLGGIPLGRFSLTWGPFRGGKTTIWARVGADVVEAGGLFYFADAERSAILPWFRQLGLVDDNSYLFTRKRSQEETQDAISKFLIGAAKAKKSGNIPQDTPILAVIDTITDLVPSDKLSGKVGTRDYGLSANYLNDWTKTALILADEAGAHIALVSQERRCGNDNNPWATRSWPGMPDYYSYRPTTGDSVLFNASTCFRISRVARLKEGSGDNEVKVGHRHEIRTMKSKLSPDVFSGRDVAGWMTSSGTGEAPPGIDRVREAIYMGIQLGSLRSVKGRIEAVWESGLAWSGEKRARAAIREDPGLYSALWIATQDLIDEDVKVNGHDYLFK